MGSKESPHNIFQSVFNCLQRGRIWVARDKDRKGQDCETHILQHAQSKFNMKARRGTAGYSKGYAGARKWEKNPQLSTLTYVIFYQQKDVGIFFFFASVASTLARPGRLSQYEEGNYREQLLDPLWRAEHGVSPISTCSRVVPKLETIRILLETIYGTLIGLAALQTSAMYHLVDHFLTAFFFFNTKNSCTSMVHLFYITFTTDIVRN